MITRIKRIRDTISLHALLIAGIVVPSIAQASVKGGLRTSAGVGNLTGVAGGGDLTAFAGSVIGRAVAVVGIIFLVLVIYAGVLWMTAGGNEERITKAKKIITGAAIGIVVVFASYFITETIFKVYYDYSGGT